MQGEVIHAGICLTSWDLRSTKQGRVLNRIRPDGWCHGRLRPSGLAVRMEVFSEYEWASGDRTPEPHGIVLAEGHVITARQVAESRLHSRTPAMRYRSERACLSTADPMKSSDSGMDYFHPASRYSRVARDQLGSRQLWSNSLRLNVWAM